MPEYLKCIPSYRRPHNVQKMESLVGDGLVWLVHDMEDLQAYKGAGAERVVVTDAASLVQQRQAILDHCRNEGVWCVSMDDDVHRTGAKSRGDYEIEDVDISYIIDTVAETMKSVDAHLGGCNYIGTFLSERVQVRDIISAGFMVINTESPVDWPYDEPLLSFRDQWEFSLRHIQEHELVVMLNYLTVAHKMNTGKGGLESQRTDMLQVESGKEMLRRWPHDLKKLKHSKKEKRLRPGEVRIIRKGYERMTPKAIAAFELLNNA